MTDPFDGLAVPHRPERPRPEFARDLRSRLVAALDLPASLPDRRPTMTSTTSAAGTTTSTDAAVAASPLVPYLCVADGAAALAWYADVFGATETLRVVGDDGRLGHAELRIGAATVYLSDEYPDYGVLAPTGDGAAVTLYLVVDAVDAVFERAAAAGAHVAQPPTDQPDGDRRGTLVDPFGHRWMIAQPVGHPAPDEYAERLAGSGYTVAAPPAAPARPAGEIWATLAYDDVRTGLAFLTGVLGFRPRLIVDDEHDPTRVTHAEVEWPEGGVVDVGSTGHNPHVDRLRGRQALYVVTADPEAVWQRCRAAGAPVVVEPHTPHYAPGTMTFGVSDPEGNVFWFGQYAG